MGEALTWHGPQANLRCDKCGKHFITVDVTTTPISKNSTPESVGRGHQGPRRGAGARILRGRERRAAAVDIGDTSEEAVNVNETTPT